MKRVISTISNVIAWVILIVAFLTTVLVFSSGRNNGVANIFGYIPLSVESDSMSPTFRQGDLIICREIDDINSLQKDDVITFWTVIDGHKVKNTHRIAEVNDLGTTRSFVTRGDNNAVNDEVPAYAGDLIGKWTDVRVAGLGKIMDFLRTKKGFFCCILIPMIIFFLFELYKFVLTVVDVKKGNQIQLDEEEIKKRAIEEYLASQKQDNGNNQTGE